MIITKIDLKKYLSIEQELYLPKKQKLKRILGSENQYKTYKYVKLLRKTEYYYNNRTSFFHKIMYGFSKRRKNILGRKLGLEMWENTFCEGLKIEHPGNIVVNGHAKIGKNCILHGGNCIGNNGLTSKSPRIGNNVRICVGAKIIGDVDIADNVIIAAGAVVINSCDVPYAVLAGVPAKIVKINSKGDNND